MKNRYIVSSLIVPISEMRKVFVDNFWNDTEDIYCVPVDAISLDIAAKICDNEFFEGWKLASVRYIISE